MKKMLFSAILIFSAILGQAQTPSADAGAAIAYVPDYYNPYAFSFHWRFRYGRPLEDGQRLSIILTANPHREKIPLRQWTYELSPGRSDGDIYLFFQNRADGKCTVRVDIVPGERISNSWILPHQPETQYELIRTAVRQVNLLPRTPLVLAKIYEQPVNSSAAETPEENTIVLKSTVVSGSRAQKETEYLFLEISLLFTVTNAEPSK